MKKTIKGITYDTEKSKALCDLMPKSVNLMSLRVTRGGRFFLEDNRYFVDGKKLPYNKQIDEFAPGSIIYGGQNWRFAPNVEKRISVKPLTRKQALAWAIRTQMPPTFHKDLARFLK